MQCCDFSLFYPVPATLRILLSGIASGGGGGGGLPYMDYIDMCCGIGGGVFEVLDP